MGKKIFLISLFFLIILIIAAYSVYQYRNQFLQAQELNKQYEEYYDEEFFLGTQLISIINKTMDLNEKNEIEKDNSGYFIDNQKNTIKIYINFVYKDDVKTVPMEDIAEMGTEEFIKIYSTEDFRCTKIEYHEKTNNVKSLTFEEI